MIGVVVDEVLKKLEKTTNEGIKADNDYTDDDTGLLVCGQCHTKKQKKIAFLGEERIVGCLPLISTLSSSKRSFVSRARSVRIL